MDKTYEPTHGIKRPDGGWYVLGDGRIISGTEREMLAAVENMRIDRNEQACVAPLPKPEKMPRKARTW